MLKTLSLLFMLISIARSVYFSIADVHMTIPTDRGRFPKNRTLLTPFAHGGTNLRYAVSAEKEGFINVIAETGDVLFTNNFIEGDINDLMGDGISATLTVKDSSGGNLDRTSLKIDLFPLKPLDCDQIVEDLCWWHSALYRVYEESPPTLIGSLASPYLTKMCPGFEINYSLNKNEDFKLVLAGDSWSLQSTRPIDRESVGHRASLQVACTVENPSQTVRSVAKNISVLIVDIDDNPPQAQEAEINTNWASNVVRKGQMVEPKDLIIHDKDTLGVNTYDVKILNDPLDLMEPICNKHENDRNGAPQTAMHCKLKFKKDVYRNTTYSVVLQLNDTSLTAKDKSLIRIPIHLHFPNAFGGHSAMTKKKFTKDLVLYPAREFKIFRTAAPLARIAQPTPELIRDAKNFVLQSDAALQDLFNVTYSDGILHVRDSKLLRKAPEYMWLNVSWTRGKMKELDEIMVRIVEEPTKTCSDGHSFDWDDWTMCSEYGRPEECLSADACAISTGGSSSVAKREGPERCMWRGDKKPGKGITHIYATCTPDIITCPDGICDSLEKLNYRICPQDCTDKVHFPAKKNPKTGRGIDEASGVCTCDDTDNCVCGPMMKKKKPKTTTESFNETNLIQPNVSRRTGNFTGKILGIELASCGTPCILGIVAGTLFLVGAVALVVLCWRLDSVHKAVRGKFNDSRDLTAPLSDYVDRSNPDPLPINFDMTTSLAGDSNGLNIISKYKPDPKWEFPRNQLTIEQTLGEGEFGRVLRAKVLNIAGKTGYSTVAVKTLKDDARETELNDLLSEYHLLKEVSHPNVIRLLGVCTAPGGPIYLIIEFAEFGSLRNYLRRSRHLKSECGRLPLSTAFVDNDIHYDEPNVSQITSKEILSFAWQICKGMAYLSEIKLVHRDLAARNVLLAAEKICKISDFGLTRDIYEDDAYFKRSKGRVPVKWMAPESLSDHVYTNRSDVWSFGILVWELVTLGATPYPGIAVQNLFHLLRQGYRMERPDNCSPTLYNIMRSCWNIEPEQRPSFQELSSLWEKMLSDEVEYLDLTNNAIHNRSYFCSPFEDISSTDSSGKSETNPLNYLSKSQSYMKCGQVDKFPDNTNIFSEPDSNQNDISPTQGYETPVKIIKRVKTPTNDCPQYYTDMASGKST